jgi:hypothetical protein
MRIRLSLAMLSLLGTAAFAQAPFPCGEAPRKNNAGPRALCETLLCFA